MIGRIKNQIYAALSDSEASLDELITLTDANPAWVYGILIEEIADGKIFVDEQYQYHLSTSILDNLFYIPPRKIFEDVFSRVVSRSRSTIKGDDQSCPN